MGYALEKKKRDAKKRLVALIVFVVVVIMVAVLSIISLIYPPATWKYYFSLPKIDTRKDGEMRLHFLDVGQGDCILIELPDGKIMLIDGGNGDDSTKTTVLRYLNAIEIDKIDYLVVTHADSDHCGSLDAVAKYKSIGRAFLPKVSPTINTEYAQLYTVLAENGCEMQYSCNSIQLNVTEGENAYRLCFLSPSTYDMEQIETIPEAESNAQSAVVWLDYNGVSAIFTGDATVEKLEKLLFMDEMGLLAPFGVQLRSTEIIKIGHHGSADSTNEEILRGLHAQLAVVSVGKGNLYGHPSTQTCTALAQAGVETYRTDIHGHVIVSVQKDADTWTAKTVK